MWYDWFFSQPWCYSVISLACMLIAMIVRSIARKISNMHIRNDLVHLAERIDEIGSSQEQKSSSESLITTYRSRNNESR